jgi:hypothetical protein
MHMFMDEDPDKAKDVTRAKFEVRIWFGSFGKSSTPIGIAKGPAAIRVVEGIQL